MPIIVTDFEQGSDEWLKARIGSPGGSSVDKIITPKGEISKSREDYMNQLAGEIITGKFEEGFKSQAMLNGSEREESSRRVFELIYGVQVQRVGMVYKDERKLFHYSPDGLLDNATLELKNPMMKTHVKYLREGSLPNDYFPQTQMGLYVCEKELCYFMSNYDGLPPFIREVRRDEKFISKMEVAIENFVADLAEVVNKLRKLH